MAIYLTLVPARPQPHRAFSGSRMVMSLYALESRRDASCTIGVLMALYALCPLFFAIAMPASWPTASVRAGR